MWPFKKRKEIAFKDTPRRPDRKLICVDVRGVLFHDSSGIHPIAGAMAWVIGASQTCDLVMVDSRRPFANNRERKRWRAMLIDNLTEFAAAELRKAQPALSETEAYRTAQDNIWRVAARIWVQDELPPFDLFISARGFQFNGPSTFPGASGLAEWGPWWQRLSEAGKRRKAAASAPALKAV